MSLQLLATLQSAPKIHIGGPKWNAIDIFSGRSAISQTEPEDGTLLVIDDHVVLVSPLPYQRNHLLDLPDAPSNNSQVICVHEWDDFRPQLAQTLQEWLRIDVEQHRTDYGALREAGVTGGRAITNKDFEPTNQETPQLYLLGRHYLPSTA